MKNGSFSGPTAILEKDQPPARQQHDGNSLGALEFRSDPKETMASADHNGVSRFRRHFGVDARLGIRAFHLHAILTSAVVLRVKMIEGST
jgi:hypothetical protein